MSGTLNPRTPFDGIDVHLVEHAGLGLVPGTNPFSVTLEQAIAAGATATSEPIFANGITVEPGGTYALKAKDSAGTIQTYIDTAGNLVRNAVSPGNIFDFISKTASESSPSPAFRFMRDTTSYSTEEHTRWSNNTTTILTLGIDGELFKGLESAADNYVYESLDAAFTGDNTFAGTSGFNGTAQFNSTVTLSGAVNLADNAGFDNNDVSLGIRNIDNAWFSFGTGYDITFRYNGTTNNLHIDDYAGSPTITIDPGTTFTGNVGIGASSPDARLEVETATDEGHQAVTIDQNDADQAFIDYQGTESGDLTNNIATGLSGHGGTTKFFKIELNGNGYWVRASTTPA